MGRYDKIRVYKDGTWYQPKRIRIWNAGGWIDLGNNDSYITSSLKVRKDGGWHRATLNRQDYSYTVGEEYAYGKFALYPKSAYGYNTSKASWGFYMKVRKVEAGDKFLVDIHNVTGSNDRPYLKIIWRNDGYIEIKNNYSGTEYSLVSARAYGLNEYIRVNIYAKKGSTKMYLGVNDEYTSKHLYGTFSNIGSVTYIGDSGLNYIEGFTCYGAAYSNNTNGYVEFRITDQYGATDTHSAISQSDKYSESGTRWV